MAARKLDIVDITRLLMGIAGCWDVLWIGWEETIKTLALDVYNDIRVLIVA